MALSELCNHWCILRYSTSVLLRETLGELLRDVVQRDIVSRYALRDSRHLMNLSLHLMAHTGQPLSLQALAKGLAIPSVAQTSRYVEYLQDAWLLLALNQRDALKEEGRSIAVLPAWEWLD